MGISISKQSLKRDLSEDLKLKIKRKWQVSSDQRGTENPVNVIRVWSVQVLAILQVQEVVALARNTVLG